MNARTLLKEVEKLEGERLSRCRQIPAGRVAFAKVFGLKPDPWQERLLRSGSSRVLMNCARQTGKSTAAGVLALHQGLIVPGALILILAPAERQAKELFSKVAGFYHTLGPPSQPIATASSA